VAWLILILACVCIVAIAGYAVFRTSARLSRTETAALYDLTEAVDWVISRVPDSIAEHLSEDSVSSLLLWQIESLRRRGVATFGAVDTVNAAAQQELVFVEEEDLVVEVLKRAWDEGLAVDELDVVVVLDAHSGYLRAIKAIGSKLDEDI